MADQPSVRLNKVLRELNISLDRAVEFLNQKGIEVDARPTTKITTEVYKTLLDEFETDKSKKVASHEISEEKRKEKETLRIIQEKKEQERLDQIAKREALKTNRVALEKPKTLGKIDLDSLNKPSPPAKEEVKPVEKKEEVVAPKIEAEKVEEKQTPPATPDEPAVKVSAEKEEGSKNASDNESETLKTKYTKLTGPKKTGQTINLDEVNKKEKTVEDARKRKRKRISKDVKPSANKNNNSNNRGGGQRKGRPNNTVKKEEPTEEEVQKQIRETLEKLQGKSNKSKGAKYRRDKRVQHRQKSEEELAQIEAESKVLKVTEFITVGEVATMMNITSTEIISACMSLGIMVTMNQRLDAETLSIVAD
jgi:translation initiation factor IF-2